MAPLHQHLPDLFLIAPFPAGVGLGSPELGGALVQPCIATLLEPSLPGEHGVTLHPKHRPLPHWH